MPCTPNCGACCDPVLLQELAVDRIFAFGPAGAQATALRDMLEPLSTASDGQVRLRCIHYDAAARACTNYEGRPPMCRDFPWYGKGARDGVLATGTVCGYVAETGRTVLPIVEVR